MFIKNPITFRKFCIVRTELCTNAELKYELELWKRQKDSLKKNQDFLQRQEELSSNGRESSSNEKEPSSNEQKLASNEQKFTKNAFGTVGPIATFEALVRAVLNPAFLKELRSAGYTNLVVQHGKDSQGFVKIFDRICPPGSSHRHGIWIEMFKFKPDGLQNEFMNAQGQLKDSKPGVIISHAGTGSILEALRAGVPLIVVPNPSLLDNRQEKLAKVLDSVGLVVHADIGNLAAALPKIETLRLKGPAFPPQTDADALETAIAGILDRLCLNEILSHGTRGGKLEM